MKNFEYIKKEINSIKETGFNKKNLKLAKKDRIDFYNSNLSKLEVLHIDKLKSHSFVNEVLYKYENLEKEKFIDKLYKIVVSLERHEYAPEMNKLHFKSSFISVPQQTSIESSIALILKNNSVEQLKEIINQNK